MRSTQRAVPSLHIRRDCCGVRRLHASPLHQDLAGSEWCRYPGDICLTYGWSTPPYCSHWTSGGHLSAKSLVKPPTFCEALFPMLQHHQVPSRTYLHRLDWWLACSPGRKLSRAIPLARWPRETRDRRLLCNNLGRLAPPPLLGKLCIPFASHHFCPLIIGVELVSLKGRYTCDGIISKANHEAQASTPQAP
jgi:hypothetical protein